MTPKRIAGRKGFGAKDVKDGETRTPNAEALEQVFVDHNCASAAVDEKRPLGEPAEDVRSKEVSRR
jgi:hypothetical protein